MTRESDLLRQAVAMVVSTPEILGGTPVVRGTRVPVHDVGAWARSGVPLEEILEHYPSLSGEQVMLSRVYADAFPLPPSAPRELPRDAEIIGEWTRPATR